MDDMKQLDELCKTLNERVTAINEGIREHGGKISDPESLYIKNILSSLKNIETIKAMKESGQSEHDGHYGAFADGGSYAWDDMSYRRGQRRDSMGRYARDSYARDGRYSGDGYSRADEREDMIGELEQLAERTGDRKYKSKIQELIQQIENS